MADPGEGPGPPLPPPPLVFRPRAEKIFFETAPPPAFLRPPLLISMSGSGTVHCILFCPTEVFDLVYRLATFTFNCVDICSDRYISGIGWLVGGSFMSETFLAINVTV